MKTTIEVSSRSEGERIRAGLRDPTARAFVIVIGALNDLASDRARARVLRFVEDQLAENFSKYQSPLAPLADRKPNGKGDSNADSKTADDEIANGAALG